MLYFTRWKALAIVLTALVVCLFAVPNFLPDKMVQSWPKWAQRHVVLGLDLQGGSHILLEVDTNAVRKEKLETLRDDVRRVLRDARVGYTGLVVRGNSVEVRIREGSNFDQAVDEAARIVPAARRHSERHRPDAASISRPRRASLVRLAVTEPALIDRVRQSVEQSIQIIERRVNELGTVEPLIQRQGTDRILVQVPGLQDPTRLKELLGKTAKLDFRMVDVSMPAEQAAQGRVPPDDEILYSTTQPKTPYLVEKRILVSGGDLTDAQPGFDQRTSEPIVSFRFNTSRRAQICASHAGKCRQALCHRPRQPGDIGAGYPRAHPWRFRPDIRQFYRRKRQRPCDPAARRRFAGAPDHHRGANGRSRAWPGFDRQRQSVILRRRGDGDRVHAGDLRIVRSVRQYRGGHQRSDDLRRVVAAQCDAHAARHCRHRAHGRNRGRLERADL